MPKVLFYDTETTGLSAEKGDKIIELALLTYDLDSRTLVDRYVQRFDPERPVSAGAQDVHGIMYSDLVGCPKFAEHAEEIAGHFLRSDLAAAHNAYFDICFLVEEFKATTVPFPDVTGFDTMESSRWACADGKYPRLEELCFALNIPFDKSAAHSAEYDVSVMARAFFEAVKRGVWTFPQEFADKMTLTA